MIDNSRSVKATSAISSGLLHLVGFPALFLVAVPGMTFVDPMPNWKFPDVVPPQAGTPLIFELANPIGATTEYPLFPPARVCGLKDESVSPARLLAQPSTERLGVAPRDPRVCVRIDKDGNVLSARVLKSSGNGEVDRTAERLARHLAFAPARRLGEAIPSTATFNLLGAERPSTIR